MKSYLEFLVFVIYNGNYRNGQNPHFDAKLPILVLVILQFMFIVMLLPFIDRLFGVSLLDILKNIGGAILVFALFFVNYWYFVRQKKFELLYAKYHASAINHQRNRAISIVIMFFFNGYDDFCNRLY